MDGAKEIPARSRLRRWWRSQFPLVRPAAITLRGLAELENRGSMRVVGVTPWEMVASEGDPTGWSVFDVSGAPAHRGGRPLRLVILRRRAEYVAAARMRSRTLERLVFHTPGGVVQAYKRKTRFRRFGGTAMGFAVAATLGALLWGRTSETWLWFDTMDLGERWLGVIAIVFIWLLLLWGSYEWLRGPVRSLRGSVVRARWSESGIAADLDTGERIEGRWSDLSRVNSSVAGYRLRFADGPVLWLPNTLAVREIVRCIVERHPPPGWAALRRRVRFYWLLFFVGMMNLMGVVVALAAIDRPRADGWGPLRVYLVFGWLMPVVGGVLLIVMFKTLVPWQSRMARRVRRRLVWPD